MNSELQAIEDQRKLRDQPVRDMFAAAALQSMIGNSLFHYPNFDVLAAMAFEAADAMMRKRGES